MRGLILFLLFTPWLGGQEADPSQRFRHQRHLHVHDPSTILVQNGVARFVSTGHGVSVMREQEDGAWEREGRIFAEENLPAWHKELVPANRGHLWAPDWIQLSDRYLLYYSVSSFGKQTSAIGLAIGKTLDPQSPDWHWEDAGVVISSNEDSPYNAIDPAIFRDDDGSLWMSFGSFWNGLYLIALDAKTGHRLAPEVPAERLATAREIEAPFLHKRGEFYYLFLNWGLCCRGLESTYTIRVGRARSVKGPFVDREGIDLREGGGTLVLGNAAHRIGPGHASVVEREGQEFLLHHFYDARARGQSRAHLAPLIWEDDWPLIKESPE
ncbi:arabinan endo-1,5-alpha-L-arabinosidase [Roseibacillus ishigakijimensis]|uniref:Arabinan endo-1,5-alpha-L-arabinosidase n=1 Tax=Roseibacillus ishigakijimensis TaxID=454146 RepID=A0A934RTE5_9BACT|nr:arabinan endo-1,5-alpha-L-arabinosidase [Roseibacillus ishigakijimensis]MBK1834171.1 arabinan endo-1,5-alpha-L-arabinosidase [Roseibacillus ishigakijimensis]